MHTTVRRTITSIALVASIATGVAATAGPAAAGGVKEVHVSPRDYMCWPDLADPECSETSGFGESNTFTVWQNADNGGDWVFDTLRTGISPSQAWIAVDFSGKCTANYRLSSAHLGVGDGVGFTGNIGFDPPGWFHPVPVNHDNQTLHPRVEDLHIPLDSLFAPPGSIPAFAPVAGFEHLVEVFQHGEAVIVQRMLDGMSQQEARAEGFTYETHVHIYGKLWCRKYAGTGYEQMAVGAEIPVRFEYQPTPPGTVIEEIKEQPTSPPGPGSDALRGTPGVTDVYLTTAVDPTDDCRLRLSGVITTTDPMEVTYRFVNELGDASPIFTVDVGVANVGWLDHHVDLPPAEAAPADETFDSVPGTSADVGFAAIEPDDVWGTYQIVVLTPNEAMSNVASYSVPPCTPEPETFDGLKALEPTEPLELESPSPLVPPLPPTTAPALRAE